MVSSENLLHIDTHTHHNESKTLGTERNRIKANTKNEPNYHNVTGKSPLELRTPFNTPSAKRDKEELKCAFAGKVTSRWIKENVKENDMSI